MALRTKPRLIVGLLLAGTLALIGVGAYAATRSPRGHAMMLVSESHATKAGPKASAAPAPTPSASAVSPTPGATANPGSASHRAAPHARSITYVVKSGDTLSGIAEWFKQHGYGHLYNANRAVIGANPNLIRPGEHITITRGVMTTFSSP